MGEKVYNKHFTTSSEQQQKSIAWILSCVCTGWDSARLGPEQLLGIWGSHRDCTRYNELRNKQASTRM